MCMTIAQSAKDHDEPHWGSTAETPMNSGEGSSRRAGKDTSVAAETSLAADLQQQARRERSCPLTALRPGLLGRRSTTVDLLRVPVSSSIGAPAVGPAASFCLLAAPRPLPPSTHHRNIEV